MFEYFIENELFTVCRSGFLPSDPHTSQLLSIIHEIQKSFDKSPPIDVRGIFYTSLRRLTKFGIKDLSINPNRMEFLVIILKLWKITQRIVTKG